MSSASNINPQTLTELLASRVAVGGVALIDRDRLVTAAALDEESRRVAQGLHDLGVREGDRVAVWLPNVPAWPACFFAAARLGAILVAVNTRFRSNEIADIVGRSGAKLLVYWPGFRNIDFEGILAEVDPAALAGVTAFIEYDEDAAAVPPASFLGRPVHRYALLARSARCEADHGCADAGCVIFTTSGTTKAPKFVLHSQRTLLVHARDVATGFALDRPDSVLLLAVPF